MAHEKLKAPDMDNLSESERWAFSETKRLIDAYFPEQTNGRALAYKILYNNFSPASRQEPE